MSATYDSVKLRELGESPQAKQAYIDYLGMGPSRSIKRLFNAYRDPDKYIQDMRKEGHPPSRKLNQLKSWSAAFRWQKRLNEVQDEQIEAILHEQRRSLAELAREGFANPIERIRALNELAEDLLKHLRDNGLLVTVIKQVGAGKNTRSVSEAKIDTPAIQALRGIFEDLAKETGGRVRIGKLSHEFPDGVPQHNQIFVLPPVREQLTEPEPEDIITVSPTPLIGANGNESESSAKSN